jgi:hypothetical protein
LVTNVAVVGALSTSETAYGPYNDAWDGTSDFRSAVSETAGETTVGIDSEAYEGMSGPGSVAFVVAPQDAHGPAGTARMRQFVARGGTLVVASEENRTNALLESVGADARIGGRPLRDPQSNYRGASLPVANNVSDHALVEGVESVTMNHAARIRPNNASVLVRTAPTAYVDRNRNGSFDPNETVGSWSVATVEPVGAGRVVVVGDAGVFTNAVFDRTDNRLFAERLAADSERALLDQSHGGPLPPIPYMLIVLRTTPLAQFAVSALALVLVAFVGAGGPGRLRDAVGRLRGPDRDPADITLGEGDIESYLAAAHPEWDDEQVRRVTKALNRRRADSADDD